MNGGASIDMQAGVLEHLFQFIDDWVSGVRCSWILVAGWDNLLDQFQNVW